ncbi:MAG: polymorphic toxin-type HINT domain-containing protein [Isosphaerales bacterium]
MLHVILMCCALIGDDRAPAVSREADLKVYESAKSTAGENANAHARLALWCEAHGLTAERIEQLALAVKYDPAYALARGLMGLVAHQGKWVRPEVVGRQIHNDPFAQEVIREYLDRRVKTASTPDAQKRLAAWCEQKGLKEQALAHYNDVIRLDPSREDVWRHLGYRKSGNRWLKAEEIAAMEQEAMQQRQADKRWKLVLEKLRADLESTDPAKRARAEKRLTEVTDARAMPMIWAHFVRGSEQREIVAVQMLGQIDGSPAAHGLAAMAVFSPRTEVRRRATQTLTRFDPRDVVESLIDLMHKPFTYQVRPVNGPGSPGELFVEGEKYNVQRFYQNQTIVPGLWGGRLFSPALAFDPFGAQNAPLRVAQNPELQQDIGINFQLQRFRETDRGLQRKLGRDVRTIETTNAGINLLNGRARAVLYAITARDFGDDPENWKRWWTDQLGYAYQSSQSQSKPTYTTFVTEVVPPPASRHHSCFGAGTLVRTVDGLSAIEEIQVGDRVLSQNTVTGSLEFQPVVAVYHNKPAATLRLAVGGEPIVATGIHRFWKAGKGWTMARELKAGDRLRAVGGVVAIQSVEEEAVQPVFNLEVAGNRDYFVGKLGTLVHDYSFVQPVREPFDREPDLAAVAPRSN